MRVLILTVELPYLTGGGGGNLRQYHLIRELSRRHEIWLVSAALPSEMDRVSEIAEHCRQLEIVSHWFRFSKPRRRWHYWANRLGYLGSPFPYEVERFAHLLPEFGRRVSGLLREGPPDLLVVEQSQIAHWHRLVPRSVPRLLAIYDVLSDVARLKTGLGWSRRERLLDRLECLKTRRYEGQNLDSYDLLVAVSEPDRSLLRQIAPSVPAAVVPNGVDREYFRPREPAPTRADLLFVGSMSHQPNEDGLLHFCSEIYPEIRARRPDATLQVVGRRPSDRVRTLDGREGIRVLGEVPDVRPYLASASVVVVPLRYGGGTRLKILEALAAGKAVVSTAVGAAGLEVAGGRDLVLADEPGDFARAVVDLLGDPGRRGELGRNGRALVESRYDWAILAGQMEAAFSRAVELSGGRTSDASRGGGRP